MIILSKFRPVNWFCTEFTNKWFDAIIFLHISSSIIGVLAAIPAYEARALYVNGP